MDITEKFNITGGIFMKRLLAILLAICCILSIVGCEVPDQTYELPHQFCYTADKLKTVEVSTNAQQRIIDILNSASWKNGRSNYEADYIFYTQNHQIEYNSENGVFFEREPMSDKETSLDIFTFDPEAYTLSAVRYGSGEDRKFHI